MRPSRITTGSPMLERKHGDGVITPRRSNVAALDGSTSARAHRVARLEDEEQMIPASPLAHRPSLVRFNSHRSRKSVDSTNNPHPPPNDDDSPPPMGESIVGSYSDGYNQLQQDTEALERQMERHRQSLLNSTPRGSKADREAAEEEFVAAAALAAIQKQLMDQPNLSYDFDDFAMESSPLDEEKGDSEMRRKKNTTSASASSSSSSSSSTTKRPSSSVAPLTIPTSSSSSSSSMAMTGSPQRSPRASPRGSPQRSTVSTPTAQLSTPVRSPQPRHSPVSPTMSGTTEKLSFLQLSDSDKRASPKRGSPQRKESPPIRRASPPVVAAPLPTGLEILASRHDHVGITHAQDDNMNASFEFAFDDDDEKVDRESNDRPVKTVVAEPVRRSSPAPALALAPTQTPRASTINSTIATPKSTTTTAMTPSSSATTPSSSGGFGFPVRPSGAISLDEIVPTLNRPSSTPTPTARTLSNPTTPNKLRAALGNPTNTNTTSTSNTSSAANSTGVSPITSPTSSTPGTPNKPLLRTVSVSSNASSTNATPTAASSRATGAGASTHLAVPSPSASTTPHGSTPPSPRSPRSPASPTSDRYSSTFAHMDQVPNFPARSASMITTGSHHAHNASHPSPNPLQGSQTPGGSAYGDKHHHSASVIIPLHSPPVLQGQSSTPLRKKRGQIFFPEGSELVRHDQLPPNKNRLHNRNGIKPILRLSSMVSDLPPAQEVFSYLPYHNMSYHRAVLPPLATYAKEHLNDFHSKLAMDAQFIRTTQCGASLVKYNSSGKPQRRWFFVEETDSEWRLIWENVKSNTEENHNGLHTSNHSPVGFESPSSSTPSSPPNGLTSPSTPNKEKSKSSSSSSNILPFFQIGKWKFNQERARSLIDVTGLHYGPYYSANFCSFLDQSNATSPSSNDNSVNKPWLCFSVQFKDRTIDLLCNNENQVTQWFLGLQALAPLSVFHMRRSQLAWQRVVMKLNHYGVSWLKESMFKSHLDHHLLQIQQTKQQTKKKAVFGAKQLRKASDRLAMSDAM